MIRFSLVLLLLAQSLRDPCRHRLGTGLAVYRFPLAEPAAQLGQLGADGGDDQIVGVILRQP